MITNTETERLSKGFAFSDVLAVGFTFKVNKVTFDVRPNFRHVSNAGLQKNNSGYNTKNIDFGVLFPL
ncbi:acyloxyacyl hydrolase [Flavobacterium sp. LB2R40]